MERYNFIKEVGDGTFGNVWRAENKLTGEIVAIKRMKRKYYSWEECMNLREVKCLRRMKHPNIIKLIEVIHDMDILYFVFEYMECNLYQAMKDREKLFSEAEIRNWCFQTLQGLAHMHHRGYFHRDLKPENLLLTKGIVKIADFGLAREINSRLPYTECIGHLNCCYNHNCTAPKYVGCGCYNRRDVLSTTTLPGSSEADEVYKICGVLGSPTRESWRESLLLARDINYNFPQSVVVVTGGQGPAASPTSMDETNDHGTCGVSTVYVDTASVDAISLISARCSWDPNKRPTALEALQHPFFQSCYYIPPSLRSRAGTPGTLSRETEDLLRCKMLKIMFQSPLSNNEISASHVVSPRAQASKSGVQLKPNRVNQNGPGKVLPENAKKDESLVFPRQLKYQPQGKNNSNPGKTSWRESGVADAAEKFADMNLGIPKMSSKQLLPPRRGAGSYVRPVDKNVWPPGFGPGHAYNTRKVAG